LPQDVGILGDLLGLTSIDYGEPLM